MPSLKPIVPAPLTCAAAPSVCVPPPKLSVAPSAALKLPLLVPPPLRLSVPLPACTVPLLLTMGQTVVRPAPAVFCSVPALSIVDAAPPPPSRVRSRIETSLRMSNVAPASLLRTAPLAKYQPAPLKTMLPKLSSVRVSSATPTGPSTASVPVAAIRVVPVPDIVPPVQVVSPVTVRSPAPVKVPPEMVKALLIDEVEAIDNMPPERTMASWLLRLLIVSLRSAMRHGDAAHIDDHIIGRRGEPEEVPVGRVFPITRRRVDPVDRRQKGALFQQFHAGYVESSPGWPPG